jgi:hypothetical protein
MAHSKVRQDQFLPFPLLLDRVFLSGVEPVKISNAQVLKTLRSAPSFSALKDVVLAMCEPAGPATSYQLIFHSDRRSVSCLLEMKYSLPDSEMRELGAYGFGNVLCLDFEVGDHVQMAAA